MQHQCVVGVVEDSVMQPIIHQDVVAFPVRRQFENLSKRASVDSQFTESNARIGAVPAVHLHGLVVAFPKQTSHPLLDPSLTDRILIAPTAATRWTRCVWQHGDAMVAARGTTFLTVFTRQEPWAYKQTTGRTGISLSQNGWIQSKAHSPPSERRLSASVATRYGILDVDTGPVVLVASGLVNVALDRSDIAPCNTGGAWSGC